MAPAILQNISRERAGASVLAMSSLFDSGSVLVPSTLRDLPDGELLMSAKLDSPFRRDAFAELVRRFEPMVFSFCHRMLRSSTEAEDVSQEVFFRVFRGISTVRSRSSVKNWLMTIARNESTRRWRKLSKKGEHERPSAEPPEGWTAANTEAGLLEELLEGCTVESREVLVLRHVGGLGFNEIAVSLGIKQSAAKMRYARAIEWLKKRHPDLTAG